MMNSGCERRCMLRKAMLFGAKRLLLDAPIEQPDCNGIRLRKIVAQPGPGCTPKLDPGFRRDDGILEPYSAAAFFWPSSFMAVPKRACA